MENTYLALYLSSTKLLIGEVNTSGKILRSKRYETGYMNQTMALSIIKRSLEDYITTEGWGTGHRPAAMGLGLLGQVDTKNSIWLGVNPDLILPIHLSEKLSEIYNIPCYIDNGVQGATLAVKFWGYGKESDNFIYLNIGSNIATGFFIDGKLIKKDNSISEEIGHSPTKLNIGVKCSYGHMNCVESIAGETGFDRSARLLKDRYSTNLYIPDDENIRVDVKEIYFLSQQNDELCIQLVNNAVEVIADVIADIDKNNNPEMIVLGGSIFSNGFLFPKIQETLEKNFNRILAKKVLLTKLNPDNIGLIGAAAIAMDKQQHFQSYDLF
ncbi:ROK family protein [Dysgonomonas sp. OttesenSCG-928-M03]|nr:ROK family protein [Dysgonomonas sp. OttesenSCG-928-M03]